MLRVIDLGKDYGDRVLFDRASFSASAHEKIGIVGPNGCGKTTLLKIICAAIAPDRGVVSFIGNPSIAFLPQHILDFGTISVGDLLAPRFSQTRTSLQSMQDQLEKRPDDIDLLSAYADAYEQFEAAGGYAFDAKLDQVLSELGMSAIELSRQLSSLSGGQLTKLALARVLLQESDLLLLDEPTNNLDQASLAWLEKSIHGCRSACLIVSHDRRFLDQITDRTLVIEPESASIMDYRGNYSFYRLRREQEIERQRREYEVQQRKIRRLTDDVREVKQQAEATENSTVNDYLRGRSKKVAAKAKAREYRLTRMIEHEQIEKPRSVERMRLRLEGRPQFDSPLITGRDITYSFPASHERCQNPEAPHLLLERLNFEIVGSARILLSGPNGSGKTTLLKLITGQLLPAEGIVVRKPTLTACFLPQQQESLVNDQNALEFFRGQVDSHRPNPRFNKDTDVRTFLHRFQFAGNQVFEPIANLSRGERTKLLLATFMAINPDLLILDEPTNHLDLATAELLEEALAQFKGALLLVSHDRYFVERINPQFNWYLATGNMHCGFMETNPQRSVENGEIPASYM